MFADLLSALANVFLLPPSFNFLLLLLGLWQLKKRAKLAKSLFTMSLVSLFLFSSAWFSGWLSASLDSAPALTALDIKTLAKNNENEFVSPDLQDGDTAIVVLSAGRRAGAKEFGGIDTVNPMTLERLHYAAWLHSKTDLPLLLSGGIRDNASTAESVLMNQTLLSAFNIAPKWMETDSKNTWQNGEFSHRILARKGIEKILLVTHANHMTRAKKAFEHTGLQVIPAPVGISQSNLSSQTWQNFFPSANALKQSHDTLHEYLGQFWYWLKYQ